MANSATTTATDTHSEHPSRRDFLYIATATVGTVGALAALVPLIDQMNPDASTLAAGGPVDVDVSKIAVGSQIMVRWRERPIWIYHRSPQALKTLQSTQDVSLLSDPNSEQPQQPPYASNWHRSIKPEYGVLVGICTHLGCIPLFYPDASATQPVAGWPGGYFCPCHGSKYDGAGRVFSGVPAPFNLPVPPYHFVNDTTIRSGENPQDSAWNFDGIRQL
jgi:ubiquinol-cytochrome c reductase iron-sulfur subunit